MKQLLTELFSRHSYSETLTEEFSLFVPDDVSKEAYWLVVESSPRAVIEKQHSWLTKCQEINRNPAVEKNTSLICIWPVEKITDKIISEVHATEEDLFFFKKHVLYHTATEIVSLNEKLGEDNIADLILNSVNNSDVFSSYKKSLGSESWEELIYRIVIKLGFIDIGEGEPADIEGLYTRHREKIRSTKQPELLSFIESSVLTSNVDGYDSAESLLKDLVDMIAEAGHEVKY
jgi:hypothetical protein